MEEYSKATEIVPLGQTPMESDLDDEIKLYIPPKKRRNSALCSACFRVWRFLVMVIAFFLIYYCLYRLYLDSARTGEDVPASVLPDETSAEETEKVTDFKLPLMIDESGMDIDLVDYFMEDSFFGLPGGEGIKVIIVNTHSSERVSSDITVAQFSDDLLKLLQSKGVSAYFDNTEYDSEGTIGAYSRMYQGVAHLKNIYNEAVILIDIHSSESGSPVTFTVGTNDDFAWQENLRFACKLYKVMNYSDGAFRMLPSSLGQDNGLLSINIGIGGEDCSNVEARARLSAFADALIEILQKEPLG